MSVAYYACQNNAHCTCISRFLELESYMYLIHISVPPLPPPFSYPHYLVTAEISERQNTETSALVHTHMHTHTHAHTHTLARTHAHTRTHARTRTHMHAHACTHTHTHTHAHTHTHHITPQLCCLDVCSRCSTNVSHVTGHVEQL